MRMDARLNSMTASLCMVDWLVRLRSLHTLYLQKEFAE